MCTIKIADSCIINRFWSRGWGRCWCWLFSSALELNLLSVEYEVTHDFEVGGIAEVGSYLHNLFLARQQSLEGSLTTGLADSEISITIEWCNTLIGNGKAGLGSVYLTLGQFDAIA